jgi:phosphoinositide-3-kinase, regulatory subunit 4
LAFQLLCAVRDCHARDIYHGDIKTENILVTSWNWLYLTDFSSSFKPVYLPEDNPADFSFFYDTAGKRTCYLAPERFLRPGEDATGKSPINWAMDIFSVGCVIAELFLESPAFSLSQLFKYRTNKNSLPEHLHLNRITDKSIRDLISHMIQVDPQDRYSAEEYLQFWKKKAFPEYFYSFLHQYMYVITDPTSGQKPLTSGSENLGEADDRIDRVYNEFDKISFFLGFGQSENRLPKRKSNNNLFPLQLDIPNNRHEVSRTADQPPDDGTLIFLTLVVASMRSTARATARVRACELLLAFAERVPDEVKLDRILPYLMSLVDDDSDIVKVAILRTITQLLLLVKVASPTNLNLFPDYILPRFRVFTSSNSTPSAWVRSSYAVCLGPLATTASRFLDLRQALGLRAAQKKRDYDSDGDMLSQSMYQNLYDAARDDLMSQFESHTTNLLTDEEVSVRRALLSSVSTLCVFFGSEKASDVILSHLNTYLNDRDWMLKCAFFETIVGVATYVGTAVLEEFILPLMVQALTDPEETVVERVIRSFSTIAQLGIFQRSTVWELLEIVSRFTMHPNECIRGAAAQFIAVSTTFASTADSHGIIMPTISKYLHVFPAKIDELSLLDNLKKPMSRLLMDMASSWAVKSDKSLFWKSAQHKTLTFAFGEVPQQALGKTVTQRSLARIPKTEEDDGWIQRLRNAGLSADDEFKLLSLQEYIWRSAHRKAQDEASEQEKLNRQRELNGRVALKDHDVGLQLVFFDKEKTAKMARQSDAEDAAKQSTSIVEALRDATSDQPLPGPRSPTGEEGGQSKPKDITGAKSGKGISSPRLLATQTVSSSLESKRSLRIPAQTIQRRGSAMSLMGLRDAASKAAPETSTDTTNAFGMVERHPTVQDGARSPSIKAPRDGRIQIYGRKIQPYHSYEGNDPNVLKLLDAWYTENYPIDLITFGRIITPMREETPQRGITQHGSRWRPEGLFVALLNEHTDCINRVVVAPDHKFFVTGSNDGTVKVWDTGRLEKSVQHRSRHTHRQGEGVKVTALAFVENTHCFVSAGSDGSIHVVQVECIDSSQEKSVRYPKLNLVRDYDLPAGSHAVWIEHHQADNQSVLIIATNDCKIYGIELRTMEIIYELKNPAHHGTPTCFCVDRRNHWLLLGTSESILDLWDLRFGIRLRSWGFPNGSPIYRLCPSPVRGSKRYHVAIAGGPPGVITVFNVEKGAIREVYMSAAASTEPVRHPSSLIPTLLDLDQQENRPGGTISRFTPSSAMHASAPSDPERGVRALLVSAHIAPEGGETKHLYMLSAGPDWKVRFWECGRPDASMIVSGLDIDEAKPLYMELKAGDAVQIVVEKPLRTEDAAGAERTPGSSGKKKRDDPASPGGSSRRKSKAVVSLQQQNLLRGHKDSIMDVALVEWPYGMVVSVDRSGVIYVHS